MWTRNSDTGKWSNQIDSLSKDSYDSLKQDLQSVILYSKCLSGSTYLPINNLDNIYDTLSINRVGYYITDPYNLITTIPSTPISLNSSNSNEFYNKYLKEDAFTLKNLFTPTKLINDQLDNYLYVDVITNGTVSNIGQTNVHLIIDGIKLIEGHRVLIKDQTSQVTLSSTVDPEVYFSTIELVSNYYEIENFVTDVTYEYHNNQNGIYTYTNNKLVKTSDLETYDSSYRYSVVAKLGTQNRDKQYHLLRLKNGYYPLSSENQNIEFSEKHNWVLRHRVDYNNIYDVNYYDILHHTNQIIYDSVDGRTYSIPSRTIAVGGFGVIINNQDELTSSATFSQSHIISNKYKVNINSISATGLYYWLCGDEGTLLRVSKVDFMIKSIELGETSNFTSISFYNNLNGMVVGKFNTIYWTKDGGDNWSKITYPEFDLYSYNKVVQYDFNKAYVGGEAGVFIEFDYSGNTWLAYKRKVAKQLNTLDEYILVEDINDMFKTSWTKLDSSTFSIDQLSNDFAQSLVFTNQIIDDYNTLQISVDSKYFSDSLFQTSEYLISFSIDDVHGNNYYQNSNFLTPTVVGTTSYDIWLGSTSSMNIFTLGLPIDSIGNLEDGTYTVRFNILYNYDYNSGSPIIIPGHLLVSGDYTLTAKNGKLLLICTNNDNIICYDIENLANNNDFIYYGFSQSHSDVKTISRFYNSPTVYIGGDQVYSFTVSDFLNIGNTATNLSTSTSSIVVDLYTNKIFSAKDENSSNNFIYFAGNNALLKTNNYPSSDYNDLDPTFNSTIKSKLLFLDYDIASKLNFFDGDGQYRLPDSVTFSSYPLISINAGLSVDSIYGQHNWLDYYKDSEKTFRYYTSMEDTNSVKFSTTFSYNNESIMPTSFTFSSSGISIELSDILPLAPSFLDNKSSRFIAGTISIATGMTSSYDLLLYDYLSIVKRTYVGITSSNGIVVDQIGDVLHLSSDVIDCSLVINYIMDDVISGDLYRYIYCYSNFNGNIINNLKSTSNTITVTNLNQYKNVNDLVYKFNLHPVSIGYGLTTSNNDIVISANFNNKTSYYNMESTIFADETKDMLYSESFLDFGYSPTYNILDYLSKINSVFSPSKEFTIMPAYINLPGNDGSSFSPNNIYIDPSVGPQSGTYSTWQRNGTNQIMFGSNFKFHWESLLINTFIDMTVSSSIFGSVTIDRLLITKKYYDSTLDGYVMEFHKKLDIPSTFTVTYFNLLSRNTLQKISDDLQLLNNIQRTSTDKSIQYLDTFVTLENELKSKFSTDSYLKVLVSDVDIRHHLTSIIYVDSDNELAMNIVNLERDIIYNLTGTIPSSVSGFTNKLGINVPGHNLSVGDFIYVEFTGGTGSSQELNPDYFGYQTVIDVAPNNVTITTSKDYGNIPYVSDYGTITFVKKDPFFNYQPIDLFNLGSDQKVTRSIEVRPENTKLSGYTYSIVNLDLAKYKFQFVDGLSLDEVNTNFPWLLEAEISDAIIGRDTNGPIWYSGTWRCGRWFGGTWVSGKWLGGDWYDGTWNSYNTKYKVTSVQVDTSYIDNTTSKWFGGRWFNGTWNGGTWYGGRRYAGDWKQGNWYNGIWNDGHWYSGNFEGGIWVQGVWDSGIFNCDSKPSYWIYGSFNSGDFENGIWYNGQFGNMMNIQSRFGTKSTNSRTSTWHGGNWLSGQFHSYLNINDQGSPDVSDIHKYSIWRTGNWNSGDFYGGIAFNINFRSGTWHGGILEEIQVVGVNPILPATYSTNSIVLNGIFKFNIGDELWIIDDDTNGAYSPLGNNSNPMKYRINKVVEDTSSRQTTVSLNYDLSKLGVTYSVATATYSNYETGLRAVSYFRHSNWQSGIWTNGIFNGGHFTSGIWYNGVFLSGTWGS